MAKFRIEGMKELQRSFRRLGDVPQKVVTPAAKKGARIALKAAKTKAPYEFGELEGGIVLKGERTRVKGKKVYQVTMDAAKNDIFAKESKAGKRSYYPASQEYGFMTVDGGYVPGLHFLRDAIDDNARQIEKTVVKEALKKVDKELKGK